MAKADLTLEYVKSRLDYDESTGNLFWKRCQAGHKRKSGYVSIHIDGVEVKAHQLVWFIAHGKWPETLIDHINGDPSDNRLENLRDASAKVNGQNKRRAYKNSTSAMLGAAWNSGRAKWQSQVTDNNGKRHYLGLFDSPEDAHAAYIEAKRRLQDGCTI